MTKVLSFRVSDDEAQWADEYAKSRGVSRQDFLVQGFRSHREDCERGVPDIPREASRPKPKTPPKSGPTQRDLNMTRQQLLNAAKYRSAS